jgi:hypothetical protein
MRTWLSEATWPTSRPTIAKNRGPSGAPKNVRGEIEAATELNNGAGPHHVSPELGLGETGCSAAKANYSTIAWPAFRAFVLCAQPPAERYC